MKPISFLSIFIALCFISTVSVAQSPDNGPTKNLYMDVHHFGAGKVSYKDVAQAHAKDLAIQNKYGVKFLKFWVDEKAGNVYCLASSEDSGAIRKTHAEAHGLLPDQIYQIKGGEEAASIAKTDYFFDIHDVGAGNVTADAVAKAHQKDLATQNKYGVNFINYWVNEKDGLVFCLSQAKDSSDLLKTHKEAHGLMPVSVSKVKVGQ